MYNWTKTDPSKLPSKQAQEVWKLEQLINYGLNGEKISRKLLQKHFDTIHIDKKRKKTICSTFMEPQGLTTQQQLILNCISDSSIAHIFTFSGGTALSSMFLHHRFSEDLDFFSLEEFDPRMLHDFISSLKDTLQYSHFDYRSSFNRHLFFLHFKNREILKLEFDYYPFPPIQKGPKYKNIQVDSLIDIAANKLHIMSVKPRSRDYIDLFFIYNVHHYNLKELYYLTKQKFDTHIDPVQLGVNLLLFDPSDMSMVHAPPPEKDIRSFFKTKVKEIESLILTE